VGGIAAQPMFDDGSNGDETADDNVFSFSTTVTGAVGDYVLAASVEDDEGRTAQADIDVEITEPLPDEIFADGFEGNDN
jgi:hypothetical protein